MKDNAAAAVAKDNEIVKQTLTSVVDDNATNAQAPLVAAEPKLVDDYSIGATATAFDVANEIAAVPAFVADIDGVFVEGLGDETAVMGTWD